MMLVDLIDIIWYHATEIRRLSCNVNHICTDVCLNVDHAKGSEFPMHCNPNTSIDLRRSEQ